MSGQGPGVGNGKPVVWLGEDRATDPASTGRKAASLARLHAAGFDVPDGFVLTTAATVATVAAGEIPEAIDRAIRAAVSRMGDVALAVRSSGVAEDLPDASFAGQYETVLGVKGPEEVGRAVMTCLASAFSPSVAAYRSGLATKGSEGESRAFAIIVQRLVPADAAGAAFTADPVTGDRDVVRISAVHGLAEDLLSGASDAEEWVVRDDSPIDGRTSPPTPWPVTRPAETGPPRPRRVRMVREPVLEPETVERIADLVRRVEYVMGAPQDVEWALGGDQLWLLQARPIGGLPIPPDGTTLAGHAWWHDEHDLAPLSALGAAVSMAGENRGFEHMFRLFGILREKSGYVAVGGLVFGRRIPPPGLPPVADGLAYAEALAACAPVQQRLPIADRALREGLAEQLVARWHEEWRVGLEREARSLLAGDLSSLDDRALTDHFDAAIDLSLYSSDIHFTTWMPYYLSLHALDLACRELLAWEPGASVGLLTGASDASSEPTNALVEIAGLIAASAAGLAALDEPESPLQRLREVEPRLGESIDRYLERFGARPMSGDPSDRTLAERPDVLVGLLRGLVARARQAPVAVTPTSVGLEDVALAALALRPAADLERFQGALAFARRACPTRDGSVLWGELATGALRAVALEIGQRLLAQGSLSRSDDVFDLEPDEIRAAVHGERGDARAIVARRRAERAWVLAHPAPAEIGEPPPPAYRTDALPGPLRRIHEAIEWRWTTLEPRVPDPPDPSRMLGGVPGSPGQHTGRVRLVRGEKDLARVEPGDVVVCQTTVPAWAPLFGTAGALVTDVGDVLSHPAILAREHGIPAVLATGVATHRFPEGAMVTVDGTAGMVTIEAE